MKARTILLALLVCACSDKKQPERKVVATLPPPPVAPEPPPPNKSPLTRAEYPTTDGNLAIGNMEAQIGGLERVVSGSNAKTPSVEQKAALVSGYLVRAQFLGKLADYDRAEAIANELAKKSPGDVNLILLRASVRSALHQYKD